MSDLTPVTREEEFLNGDTSLEPKTREECILAGIDMKPFKTRREWFLDKYRGGGSISIDSLTVTENGTYTASTGHAYNPVNVDVPLPSNAYLKKSATSYPISPSILPLPKAEVTFEGNKAELYMGSESISVSTDTAPYLYRQSPSGKSAVDLSITGGTVAWNQIAPTSNLPSITTFSNGVYTLNYTPTGTASRQIVGSATYSANHVIYADVKFKKTYDNVPTFRLYSPAAGSYYGEYFNTSKAQVLKNESTNIQLWQNYVEANKEYKLDFCYTIIDLTQMFGSTIADYIYSLEQATAGSGIAWLKSYGFMTKSYYAYDGGSLQSVNVASRKVYDSNDMLVATYPLDGDLTLRGIPKLSNGELYYDGDVYTSDGSVKRKYGVVDLGTLSWSNNATDSVYALVNNMAVQDADSICIYPKVDSSTSASDMPNGSHKTIDNNQIVIKLSGITASNASSMLDGVDFVFELAVATTESAQPFTNPQLVGSTEEFVDAQTRDADVPCGQESKYVNGDIYIAYGTSPIDFASQGVTPYESTYISSNGTESVEYWAKE